MELRRRGLTDVDDSVLARALYSSDASLYRVVPQVVARPRHPDEIVATLDAARALGVPLTMRGAGTSIAGNAVGPGIVVDTARHLNQVLSLDPESRTAVVQPGVVHASLTREALAHGLRFGPDPSTHTRCTIGGMIGNNACGSRALGYGRTADNVAGMKVAFGTGEVGWSSRRRFDGRGGPRASTAEARSPRWWTSTWRTCGRRSGGSRGRSVATPSSTSSPRTAVGRTGSWSARRARWRWCSRRRWSWSPTTAIVSSWPWVIRRWPRPPMRCQRCSRAARARPPGSSPARDWTPGSSTSSGPRGGGAGPAARIRMALRRGRRGRRRRPRSSRSLARPGRWTDVWWTDPAEAAALWRIREDGAGLAARSLDRPAYSGWEDAAVPPDRLGEWLREFDDLLREHGLDGVPYGHFGDGCVHVRIDFEFDDGAAASATSSSRGAGPEALRRLAVGRAR